MHNQSLFADLWDGMKMWRLWTAFGYEDLRHQYRRTLLGLTWIVISFGAFTFVYILVFGGLNPSHSEIDFASWVAAGFVAWQFISHVITMGVNVFISSEGWIRGIRLPLSVHVFQHLWRLVIQDGLSLLVAYALILAFGRYSVPGLFLALLALPLYMLLAFPVQIVLGLICTRIRDLQQFVGTVMRLMFFVTPIIWTPVPDTIRQVAADLNPFSYLLALFRDPILYGYIPLEGLAVWAVFMVVFWSLAAVTYRALRPHIAYWL